MAAFELATDAVLGDGRYRLKSRLGAGGMASVWLAHDERLDRRVAVKVIADTLAGDERYRERFAREARAAASVSHPSIVPVYDYGLQDTRPFLVMEYVPGGSLADVLDGRKSVVLDVVEVASGLLSALDCVHRAGLAHRDVKPANILLDAAGHPRLTDFGIARPEDAPSLTQTGMIIGTLRYLAPEVVRGARAGTAADLYAAGVVLRELAKQQSARGLTPLIAALTAADPGDRPASAPAALELIAMGNTPGAARTAQTRVAPATTATDRAVRVVTEHTRVMTDQTRRMAGHLRVQPAARGISRRAGLAAAVAVLLVLVLVIITLAGGGGRPSPTAKKAGASALAPAAAPLTDQLRALRQLVDQAAAKP